jgi:WD40 repeat protein
MSRLAAPSSPFKGLAAFDDSDSDALLFFGREREIEVIAANLQAARLTVLYGPSGVGKSSVLRAGVAPRLRREPNVQVEIFDRWRGPAVGAVRRSVEAHDRAVDLYLILDQFEEYFLYHENDEDLPALLAGLVSDASARVNVLVGIREDAVAELDAFRRLLPTLLSNRLGLDRLDRAAAREAIVRPVERYAELAGERIAVEPTLVERVLDEVTAGRVGFAGSLHGGADGDRSERIEAPYLQLVLQTVWEAERAERSDTLRAETLDRLGGAARIVEEHLEEAMGDFSDDDKDAAAAMYNFLVTPSGTKIAHRVGDLARYASLSEPRAARVLEKLAHERIVRASSENGPASMHYEIFHDVLADAVLAWRSRYEEQRALRDADRRRRRAFVVATASVAALILVAAIAVYALVERGNSQSQARRARAEALAAESLTQLGIDPSHSLRLAYDAARLRPDAREEGVLRTALLADRLRRVLRAGGPVIAVAYDASGRHELVASRNGKVRVFGRKSSRPLRTFDAGETLTAAALSVDGGSVAAGGDQGRVHLWRGKKARSFALRGAIRSMTFVRGRLVVAAEKELAGWRVRDGKRVISVPVHSSRRLVKLVVSPDGRQAVVQFRYRRADVVALPGGRVLFRLRHNGFIEDASYSPDGRLIVTGGYAGGVGGVRLWNRHTGQLVRDLRGALLHVEGVAFSDDGTLVGAASADGTARIWQAATGTVTAIMIGHQNTVTSVDFNPAGGALVSASTDGTARVWGAGGGEAGRILSVLAGHEAPVVSALFAPDGRSVLTGGDDGTARLWDPGSEPELTLLARSRQPLVDVGETKDGRSVVVRFADGKLQRRSLGGALVTGAGPLRRDHTVALSHDGRLRARGFADGRVSVMRGGRVLWDRRVHALGVNSVAFSPGDDLVVSAGEDREALILDAETGHVVQRLHGHFGPVADAEFSPDGRWVVTAGPITAGLWLVGSTAPAIFLDAPVKRPLSAATFAGPRGRDVVVTSLDGSLRRYQCEICGNVGDLIALAQRRLVAER